MSHSRVYFLILNLAFFITSIAVADDVRYRYLTPLSTNLKLEDFENSEEVERIIPDDFIYRNRETPHNFKMDQEFIHKLSKSAAEKLRESKWKLKEIEREVLRNRLEGERELKKILVQIDREHRKYIVEMEREERKHREEMEREYRKQLKEMEED
ncbi:hypothetical protein L0222_13465 [bacterium]|nr:hypothetical protein [bacterium]